MWWSSDIVRNQLPPEVPHRRHDWVASRHLQGRPTRQKHARLSSLVSSAFSISSHVHCIICFLHQHLLDSCVRESDEDHNSADYHVILWLSHTSNENPWLRMCALTEMPPCVLQIEYSFRWLQTPLEKRLWEKNGYRPLVAVNVMTLLHNIANSPSCKCLLRIQILVPLMTVGFFVQAMVQYNRLELLNHPVCKKYLAMKW